MTEYLEIPWSIEDTIENLKELKEVLQERCIIQNLHGRGEKDAEEVAFDFDRAINALEEVQKYRAIGTVVECREAVDNRRAKRPTYEGDGYAPDGTFVWDEWICPNCDTRYEVDYDDYDYCPNCGQAIDWSDEE